MASLQIDGFFYGLFMDAGVLNEAGLRPSNFRRAYVNDFALCIGRRATLVPSPGARAYGMLISLTQADLDRLYSAPGLEDYQPETVTAHPYEGEAVSALCYNLAQAPGPQERNLEYAKRLQSVLKIHGFPDDYIESVGQEPGLES